MAVAAAARPDRERDAAVGAAVDAHQILARHVLRGFDACPDGQEHGVRAVAGREHRGSHLGGGRDPHDLDAVRRRRDGSDQLAVAGAVVSKPTAKKTT